MILSQNKLLLITGGGIIIVIILVAIVMISRIGGEGGSTSGGKVSLEFWGVFDEANNFRASLGAFNQKYPGISIVYKVFNTENYEEELTNALAARRGPDIWMVHNAWLPRYLERLSPLPSQLMTGEQPLFTLRDFQNQFVDVAEKDLVVDGRIYALPLYIDTLALFYNKNIFNSKGISQPPSTWEEFNELVEKITVISEDNNQIIESAVPMGTAKNINRSTDIVSLLMMQSGVPMANPKTGLVNFSHSVEGKDAGATALKYYTDFANPDKRVYTWNSQRFWSVDEFREGRTAMMFNYAHQIDTLHSQAPRLNFGIASMPQLNSSQKINYASYWVPAVSKFSAHQEEAWRFLVYLSSLEGVVPYLNSANVRPTARRDLIGQQKEDVNIGVFAEQTLTAQSWYQLDNRIVESAMAEMIEDINYGRKTLDSALRDGQNKINLLIRQQ